MTEIDPKPLPWHLVDLCWHTDEVAQFDSAAIDFELSGDIDPSVGFYIAPFGDGFLNDVMFYAGVQTRVLVPTVQGYEDIGRGLIFSRWDERMREAIRPDADGFWESSGYEGDFVSVRNSLNWGRGRYTLTVRALNRESDGDRTLWWVGMYVYSHSDLAMKFAGALRWYGDNLILRGNLASFLEIYGWPIAEESIPSLQVAFANLTINGEAVPLPAVTAFYAPNAPNTARASRSGQSIVVRLGDEHSRAGMPLNEYGVPFEVLT